MPFWKSSGLNRFGGWTSLFAALVVIRLVLLDLTSFTDTQEIRSALLKTEGVGRVSPLEEAPGVVTWEVSFEGTPEALIDRLLGVFDKRYNFVKKPLPSGAAEIAVTKATSP